MDVAALKASWAAAAQLGDRAAEFFYATLFSLDPTLREMFPPFMGHQRGKLLAALGHIVSNVDDGETLVAFVKQLGADHRRFDVRPEHYPVVGQALIHTLATGLGEAWTPQLQADWTEAYTLVSNTMMAAAAERERAEPPFWEAEIVGHERRTGDVAVVTVRPSQPYHFRPGQSMAVETHLRPEVWRYLSPASAPRVDGTIELHVRAVPGGQFSPALVYHAQKGDVLRLGAPIGTRLTLPDGPGADLLMLAGGTGLAPMKALIEQVGGQATPRRVTLVIGASYSFELYDQQSLQAMIDAYPWLGVVAALTDDPTASYRGTAVDVAVQGGRWYDREIYVCGSPGMVAGTCQVLLANGYAGSSLHVEQYDGENYAPLQAEQSVDEFLERVAGR